MNKPKGRTNEVAKGLGFPKGFRGSIHQTGFVRDFGSVVVGEFESGFGSSGLEMPPSAQGARHLGLRNPEPAAEIGLADAEFGTEALKEFPVHTGPLVSCTVLHNSP